MPYADLTFAEEYFSDRAYTDNWQNAAESDKLKAEFFEYCKKVPFEKLSKVTSTIVLKKENGIVRPMLIDMWDSR